MSKEFTQFIKGFESGYYRLTEDLKNPNTDKRNKYDYFKVNPVFKAGKAFQVIVTGIDVDGVGYIKTGASVYTLNGDGAVSGSIRDDAARFLLEKLEKMEDTLQTVMDETNVTADDILKQLMKTSKLNITDIKLAAKKLTE